MNVHRYHIPRWTWQHSVAAAAPAVLIAMGYGIANGSRLAIVAGLVVPAAAILFLQPGAGFLIAVAASVAFEDRVPGMWLVVPVCGATGLVIRKHRVRIYAVDYAFAAWVGWVLVSWKLHPLLGIGRKAFLVGATPLLFYVWARLAFTTATAKRTLWTLLCAGTFGAGTVLYEWAHGRVLFSDPARYQWGGGSGEIFRPGGIYGGSPAAAIVLAMVLLATIPLWRVARRLALVCHVLIALAIVVTFGRAGWIGFAIGALLLGFLLPLRRVGRVVYLVLVMATLLFAVQGALANNQTFRLGVVRPGSTSGRVDFLRVAAPLATDSRSHFLLGRGFDAFETTTYTDARVADRAPILLQRGGPHNEYFRALLEQGLVGLALLSFWIFGSLRTGVKSARALPPESDVRLLIASLSGAAAVFIAAGMFHDLSHNIASLSAGAMVFGMLVSAAKEKSSL